jgi:hypothetical protein
VQTYRCRFRFGLFRFHKSRTQVADRRAVVGDKWSWTGIYKIPAKKHSKGIIPVNSHIRREGNTNSRKKDKLLINILTN